MSIETKTLGDHEVTNVSCSGCNGCVLVLTLVVVVIWVVQNFEYIVSVIK